MERIYKVATFTLSMALAFGGVTALNYLSSSPIEFATEQENHTVGGEHSTLITVSADARKLIPRPEAIRFYIQNRFSSPAVVSYSLLLTDEKGEEIISLPTSPVATLTKGETATYELSEPGFLDDGLYTYQITAVGRANGKFADSGIELNFAVLNNSFYILTNEEWFSLSLANGATSQ